MRALPNHLRAAVNSVSTTVQQLIFEVALHVSGMPAEPRQDIDRERVKRGNNNGPAPADLGQLRDYVYDNPKMLSFDGGHGRKLAQGVVIERAAIGIAALEGHTAREIAEFFGWSRWERGIKGKLERLRAAARRES